MVRCKTFGAVAAATVLAGCSLLTNFDELSASRVIVVSVPSDAGGAGTGGDDASVEDESGVTSDGGVVSCSDNPFRESFEDRLLPCWNSFGGAPAFVSGQPGMGLASSFAVAAGAGPKYIERSLIRAVDDNRIRVEFLWRVTQPPVDGFVKGPFVTLGTMGAIRLGVAVNDRKLICDTDPADTNDVPVGTAVTGGEWLPIAFEITQRTNLTYVQCTGPGVDVTTSTTAEIATQATLRVGVTSDEVAAQIDVDALVITSSHVQ